MTSSSAPPTAPASEPFRFTDSARLHARRFNKHPLASALRLFSADQRITHPDGGIGLLTEAGHVIRATALFAASYVPAFFGMVSDVATEPHHGIGNQLLAEVVSRADEANADIVLTVGETNEIARALYARHHFLVIDGRGQTIAMRRRVGAGEASASHRNLSAAR